MTEDTSGAFFETAARSACASPGQRHCGTSTRHLTKRFAQSLVTHLGHQPDPLEPFRHQRHAAKLSDNSQHDASDD